MIYPLTGILQYYRAAARDVARGTYAKKRPASTGLAVLAPRIENQTVPGVHPLRQPAVPGLPRTQGRTGAFTGRYFMVRLDA